MGCSLRLSSRGEHRQFHRGEVQHISRVAQSAGLGGKPPGQLEVFAIAGADHQQIREGGWLGDLHGEGNEESMLGRSRYEYVLTGLCQCAV